MQLDEFRHCRRIVKVEARHFQHVVAQLLPGFSFRKDRLPQRPRHVAALFRLAYLEDQFHANRITEESLPQALHPSPFFWRRVGENRRAPQGSVSGPGHTTGQPALSLPNGRTPQWPGNIPHSITSVMPITMMLVPHAIQFHRREFLCSPIRSSRLMSISIRMMTTGSKTPFSTCDRMATLISCASGKSSTVSAPPAINN